MIILTDKISHMSLDFEKVINITYKPFRIRKNLASLFPERPMQTSKSFVFTKIIFLSEIVVKHSPSLCCFEKNFVRQNELI